ncbi:hypothetical protein [Alteromonas sp. CYL-A6]|uniref:hypothetical protein n=1 Tax=Alteromonas nitratireducens TaxID=3390813 RepID=UPI0034BBDCA3
MAGDEWQSALAPAYQLMAEGDEKGALLLYRQEADRGNPLAQFALGWHYKVAADNSTVDTDKSEQREQACQWFVLSGDKHIPVALHEAGHCFRDGILDAQGGNKDGHYYYQAAVDNGLVAAGCDVMALTAYDQPGYPQSLAQCEAAATEGSIYAQRHLIEHFIASPQNDSNLKAVYWLSVAAKKYGPEAYRYGLTLAQSTPADPEQALYWLEHAASLGFLPAYLETAVRYVSKITPETPTEQASAWLAKAYLWSHAWAARVPQDNPRPAWLTDIDQTVPPAWRPALDEKIARHIAGLTDSSVNH